MASRRLFIGKDGSSYKLRQSKPGYDAKTAALENCLFDADFPPTVVMGTGDFLADVIDLGTATTTHPKQTTVAHGFSRAPDMLVAVAAPVAIDDGTLLRWLGFGNMTGSPGIENFNNSRMDYHWSGPFWYYREAGSWNASVGWWYDVDATNITIKTFCPSASPKPATPSIYSNAKLRVKWTALRFA